MPSSTNEKTGTHGSCQKAAASCSSNLDANLVSLWHSAHQLSRLVLVKCDLTLSPSGDWLSNCVAQIFSISPRLLAALATHGNQLSKFFFSSKDVFLNFQYSGKQGINAGYIHYPQAFLQLLLPL